MTTIKLTNGKQLNVRGTISEIVKSYEAKKNTTVSSSRINDNLTIYIDGTNVGEIVC